MSSTQMELAVKLLKHRLRSDHTTFCGNSAEYDQIRDLITRTSENGESNSALVIGTAGCGKTTMITSILGDLLIKPEFRSNTLIVQLNGYVLTDDALALKSITKQMHLETAVDGKVFTTFADNLAFLLDCLRSGNRKQSKSVIFVLDEFDLFCGHTNQTLIYNLFDVAQSAQAPICVIGLTRRNDVIEILEKRVKSRFSHRQIFLFNENPSEENHTEMFLASLRLPTAKEIKSNRNDELRKVFKECDNQLLRHSFDLSEYSGLFKDDFVSKWNKEVAGLRTNKQFASDLKELFNHSTTLSVQKMLLFRIVANISDLHEEKIAPKTAKVAQITHHVIDKYLQSFSKVDIMLDLSILELSLMIAIKHHNEIYDRDPFNFEIILTRLHKFQNSNMISTGATDRAVVLKAFDVLKHLGLITPIGNSAKELKEYQMHRLQTLSSHIDKTVAQYKHLPTSISQWATISQI